VFRRLYRGLVNAIYISRAFRATAESRDNDAMNILGRKVRDAEGLYYVRLLRGHLLERAGRFEEALREYLAGHDLTLKPSHLAGFEKVYFETYAAAAALRCAQKLPAGALPPDAAARLRLRFDEIELRRIPGQVKAHFPLPEHPKWGKA
jgi:hypothetical protein